MRSFFFKLLLIVLIVVSCSRRKSKEVIVGSWEMINMADTTKGKIVDRMTFDKIDSVSITILVNDTINEEFKAQYKVSPDLNYLRLNTNTLIFNYEIMTLNKDSLSIKQEGKDLINHFKRIN